MIAAQPQPTGYRPGVGIVLVNGKGLVFVGHRCDDRAHPWQMPQGGLQGGEAPGQAVLREIREELGIDAVTVIESRPDWLTYDYPDLRTSRRAAHYRGQTHLWYLLRFDGQDDDIRLDSQHAEFSRWRWSLPADVVDQAVPFKRPVYREVLQFFAAPIRRLARDNSSGLAKSAEHRISL